MTTPTTPTPQATQDPQEAPQRQIWPGHPYPLGATYDGSGTNFALYSSAATGVDLCLFDVDGHEERVALKEVDGDGFTLGAGTLVHLGELSRQELADGVELVLREVEQAPADWRGEVHAILDAARVEYMAKDLAWAAVRRGLSGTALLGEMESLGLPETLRSAVAEVL